MKLKVDYKELLSMVEKVSVAADIRQDNVYRCVFIQALLDKLVLSTTNLELFVKTETTAEVKEQGSVLVNADIFFKSVKKMSANQISLELKNNQLLIRSIETGSTTRMQSLDELGPFPENKQEILGDSCIFNGKIFNKMVQKILFVGDPYAKDISSVNATATIFVKDNIMKLQILDDYRIGVRMEDIEENESFSFKLRLKNLKEIATLIKDEEEVKIINSNNHLDIRFKNTYVASRAINTQTMNAVEYFGDKFHQNSSFTLKRQQLIDTLERALVFEGKAHFFIDIKKDGYALLTAQTESGAVEDKVKATLNGDEIKVCFNAKFGIEIFKALDSEDITIYYIDKKNPLIITDNKNYFYILMLINYEYK